MPNDSRCAHYTHRSGGLEEREGPVQRELVLVEIVHVIGGGAEYRVRLFGRLLAGEVTRRDQLLRLLRYFDGSVLDVLRSNNDRSISLSRAELALCKLLSSVGVCTTRGIRW